MTTRCFANHMTVCKGGSGPCKEKVGGLRFKTRSSRSIEAATDCWPNGASWKDFEILPHHQHKQAADSPERSNGQRRLQLSHHRRNINITPTADVVDSRQTPVNSISTGCHFHVSAAATVSVIAAAAATAAAFKATLACVN